MTFYHGSPIGDLTELHPFLSEHGKPYVYFSTNPLVALLYAVKPVPKPFSFYPYGFDKQGNVVYSEYFENAFYELYKNKRGYLYECDDLPNTDNQTSINSAITCTEPIKVSRVTEIPDLYEYFIKAQSDGSFCIKPKNEISEKEMCYIIDELKKEYYKHGIENQPNHPMHIFLAKHFPNVLEQKSESI